MLLETTIERSNDYLGFWRCYYSNSEEGPQKRISYRVYALLIGNVFSLYCIDCSKNPFFGKVAHTFGSASTEKEALKMLREYIEGCPKHVEIPD